MSIEEALVEILSADVTLTALVGDRIFPGEIPDDEAASPWLYYSVTNETPFDQLDDGPEDVRSEVEFHALADRYGQAKLIIERVISLLKAAQGGDVIRQAFWAETSAETTEDGYHRVTRFTIHWRRF